MGSGRVSGANLVGTTLHNGKYTVEQELGSGGFGITYRAIRHPLNQVVVVKTLRWPQNKLENAQQLQRFQAEARRLAQCQHPNIVNVTDFFVEAERPYLVMDFIPGQPLSALIFPQRPLPEARALHYIQQIAGALQTVHSQGLLHRDVKPQNIMIDGANAILIDFGIARELSSGQTQTHTNLVSEGYAPLEQYLPKARRSAASDVYGLAATLYAAVTGEVPVASVLRSHQPLTPPRQLNPRLGQGMEQAILQGMALELAQRPQSVATWLRLLSTGARRSQAPGPTTRPTQVVAPRMPSGYALNSDTQTNNPAAWSPEEISEDMPDETFWPSRRNPGGLKLVPNLFKAIPSLLFLGLLTGVGFVGYRLYLGAQQAMANLRERTAELPELSMPEVKFPEVTLPEITLPNLEEILADLPSTPTDTSEPPPPADPVPELQPPPVETNAPLILGSSGNPNTTAGGGGGVVTGTGISTGTAATAVINRLGEPTRQSISPSATTAVYELDPNRATVAYRYDAAGNTVQQAEAVFAPSYDRLIMRVALTGMLNGQSTRAIETGLDQVRSGQIDRYPFEQNGLTGSIERNNSGFIHIHVR